MGDRIVQGFSMSDKLIVVSVEEKWNLGKSLFNSTIFESKLRRLFLNTTAAEMLSMVVIIVILERRGT